MIGEFYAAPAAQWAVAIGLATVVAGCVVAWAFNHALHGDEE